MCVGTVTSCMSDVQMCKQHQGNTVQVQDWWQVSGSGRGGQGFGSLSRDIERLEDAGHRTSRRGPGQ